MKPTLAISYNGGTYGTYLEWVLTNLLSRDEIQSPLTEIGNSHEYKGYFYGGLPAFRKYANSDTVYPVIRVHPKILSSDDVKKGLTEVLDHCEKLIVLYPDRSHELLCVCNYMTKIWVGQHHYDGAMAYINKSDITQNYPVDPSIDFKDLPVWIQREHMSFNLFSSWKSQVDWYFPDRWQHPRSLTITTKQLLEDFPKTLKIIEDFWGRKYHRSIDDLIDHHTLMLNKQQNLGKDQLCNDILDSLLDLKDPMHWNELCLVSQAWIQHRLRELGYELQCHDLNEFPKTTQELQALIFKAK